MKRLLSILCVFLASCTFSVSGGISKDASKTQIAAASVALIGLATIFYLHQQPPAPVIMPSDAQRVDYEPNNDCLPKPL